MKTMDSSKARFNSFIQNSVHNNSNFLPEGNYNFNKVTLNATSKGQSTVLLDSQIFRDSERVSNKFNHLSQQQEVSNSILGIPFQQKTTTFNSLLDSNKFQVPPESIQTIIRFENGYDHILPMNLSIVNSTLKEIGKDSKTEVEFTRKNIIYLPSSQEPILKNKGLFGPVISSFISQKSKAYCSNGSSEIRNKNIKDEMVIIPYYPDQYLTKRRTGLDGEEKTRQISRIQQLTSRSEAIASIIDKVDKLNQFIENNAHIRGNFEACVLKNILSEYCAWALEQLKLFSKINKNCELFLNKEKVALFQHRIFISINDLLGVSPRSPYDEIKLKASPFNGNFLEEGVQFYTKKLDPLELWLQSHELVKLFKVQSKFNLCHVILLILYRYSTIDDQEINDIESDHYNQVRSQISSIYSKPSYFNLLALIMLGFYEASYYRLSNFKRYLSNSIRMAQILSYDKIETDEICTIDNNDVIPNWKKRRIFDMLMSTNFLLGYIVGEPMLRCLPYNPSHTSYIKEYHNSPYVSFISNLESIDRYSILSQTSKHNDRFFKLLSLFSAKDDQARQRFLNFNPKKPFDSFVKLPNKPDPYLQSQLQFYINSFDEKFDIEEWLSDVEYLSQFALTHANAHNWITFGPIQPTICLPLLLLFPDSFYLNPLHGIDLIECLPRILCFFFKEFSSWRSKVFENFYNP